MSYERKRRIAESCKVTLSPDKVVNEESYLMTRNWATAGFFDSIQSLESIRQPNPDQEREKYEQLEKLKLSFVKNSEIFGFEDESRKSLPQRSQEVKASVGEGGVSKFDVYGRGRRFLEKNLSRMDSIPQAESFGIELGEVYEQIDRRGVRNGARLLYTIIEVYPQSKSCLVQTQYGKEKKLLKDFTDESMYRLVLTEKGASRRRTYRPQHSVRDPLLHDKAKYSGEEGRAALFSLFKQAPEYGLYSPIRPCHLKESRDTPDDNLSIGESSMSMSLSMPPPSSPSRSLSPPLTPRVAYVIECRKSQLPPIPLLSRCYDESYPVLNLANQSVGERFASALSLSLPKMTFLREVNLTGNRFDQRGSACIIASLLGSRVESIILDNNKIGKGGVKALCCLVSGERFENLSMMSPSQMRGDLSPDKPSSLPSLSLSSPSQSPSLRRGAIESLRPSSSLSLTTSSDILHHKQQLVKISINENQLGDCVCSKLINTLQIHCKTLRSLLLRGNSCAMSSAHALQTLLRDTEIRICCIDISWNDLHTDGADLLLRAVAKHPSLTHLHLDWNGIGAEIRPRLAEIASGNKIIKLISIDNNHLLKSFIEDIERSTNRRLFSKLEVQVLA
jgi:Ran GTPase-activating protein (RanGAP) involved in mRNA processing and transport